MPHARGILRFVRKRRRLSQKQVAHLIGHQDTTMLSKYERGQVTPPLRTAIKLTLIYGVPLQELFKDESTRARDELASKTKELQPAQSVLF